MIEVLLYLLSEKGGSISEPPKRRRRAVRERTNAILSLSRHKGALLISPGIPENHLWEKDFERGRKLRFGIRPPSLTLLSTAKREKERSPCR